MVESLAQRRGLIATFMAKPFAHLTGSGAHFHFSLWRGGGNAFERDASEDPRGLGLSELAYQFIGGLKANAKAYIAFTAPAFGKTPHGDYLDYYITVKRREWQQAHEQITRWELDRYLQLF
jgi:glutamine synthetase